MGAGTRVLLVAGSTSRQSRARTLAHLAATTLDGAGADTAVWDLAEHRIPMPGVDDNRVKSFRCAVRSAHALVLLTPLCHNSYSGVLKNALDHLELQDVRNRPVALISAGSGSPQAVDHLRIVVRSLHAVAIPCQVVAQHTDFQVGANGHEIAGADLGRAVRELCRELLWFAQSLQRGASLEQEAAIPSPRVKPEPDDDPLRRALAFIQENFTDSDLCLDDVARHAYLSRYHFSRVFKARTGTGFIGHVTELRLENASTLLLTTEMSVTSICHAVGYRDLSHFERVFRKRYGVTPSTYRTRAGAGVSERAS
ncbi:NAD(P)H-dependent oxidoreductase [Lentzea sp. HUAS TT2]|uniref:NAD(P)H-dependent oxidoreductase n=1 Tax=Lentzea sp. HUAS TT2 TaxID=3447454 RepID=UPI003F6E72BA